jgi:hypothetical protein
VRIWSLTHSLEGTSVRLTEVPFWALAAQYLAEEAESRHFAGFCMLDPPEWTWNIRWGDPEEDGYNPRTLGSVIWRFGNALLSGFGAYKHEKDIVSIPVSYEWVREHFPDAGGPWDGSWKDEDDRDQGVQAGGDV